GFFVTIIFNQTGFLCFCDLLFLRLITGEIESHYLIGAQGEEGWPPNRGKLFIQKDSADENRRIA
ncbi:hypothetical protein, partial [Escherichia coli]|uniref:hypothetical protein n=1 Tax=Escherichia coli TaxID=562 RepID=UPI001A7E0FBE